MQRSRGSFLAVVRAIWSRFPPHSWRRSVVSASLFVLGTELLLHCLYEHDLLSQLATAAMDRMMVQHLGFVRHARPPPGLALLDADDETWSDWQDPPAYPKANLLRLIDYARESGARAIVVDVDTSAAAMGGTPEGNMLADYLRRYGTDKRVPPLIMAAKVSPDTPGAERVLIHDSLLPQAEAASVRWGSTLFALDPDGTVRRWRLWEAECLPGKPPRPIASTQVLVLGAMDGPAAGEALGRTLGQLAQARCEGPSIERSRLMLRGFPLELSQGGRGERILYTITPKTPETAADIEVNGHPASVLTVVSVGALLRALDPVPALQQIERPAPSSDPVRGRVVIISATARGAGNWLVTPVGPLPGAYVLINALTTIAQFGNLQEPDLFSSLAIGMVLGMMVWALLEFVQFSIALLLATGLVLAASLLLSRYFLQQGVWVDALFPSLGVFVHRWFIVLHTLWSGRREHGWRVLLTPRFQARSRTLGIVLLVATLGGAAAAEPAPVGGRIVAMPGLPSQVRVTRLGSGALQGNYLADLYAGDRVEVLGGSPIMVKLADQELPVTLRFGDKALEVPIPASSMPLLSRLTHAAFEWIGSQKHSLTPPLVSTTVREAEIHIRLLENGSRFAAAGRRTVPLVVSGAAAPYQIRLQNGDGRTVVALTEALQERVNLPLADLLPGVYSIEVADADGRHSTWAFDVVPSDRLPSIPAEALMGLPADAAATVTAAWLAGHQDGAWSLEASIRAAELSSRYEPAAVLLAALLRGRLPD